MAVSRGLSAGFIITCPSRRAASCARATIRTASGWDSAELLEDAEDVEHHPMLGDLAVPAAKDVDLLPFNRPTRCRDARWERGAGVRAAGYHPHRNQVILGQGLVEAGRDIRERSADALHDLDKLGLASFANAREIVVDIVVGQDLIGA